MKDTLLEKVIVITGASSGIGRATALAFAKQGARLVLAARGRAGLDSLAFEIERYAGRPLVVPTDVTQSDEVIALARTAIEGFGHIDVWINNVGVGAVGRFEDVPLDFHRRVVESNLLGHMHGAHAVLPHFRERRRGTLVNMISLAGWVPAPLAAAYSASKMGLRGFSEALRAEASDMPDLHICAVYPTFVDTPGFAHGANYTGRHLSPPSPLLDPRVVADAIVDVVRSPRATVAIGSVATPARMVHALAPDLSSRLACRGMEAALRRARTEPIRAGNLFDPSVGHGVDGGYRKQSAGSERAIAATLLVGGLAWLLGRMVRSHR